jgi:TetR/AcrR family transcriptional regulator
MVVGELKLGQGDTARERLLAAAIELFDRKGYAATTVREIVAAAGVTQPVLYYYFGNKEGIFLELMGQGFRMFDELAANVRSLRGSARRKIARLCETTFELFEHNIPVVRVMYAMYYGPQHGAPTFDFDAYHKRFQELLVEFVNEGVAAGEFAARRAEELVWAVIGATNIAMEMELCHPEAPVGRAGLVRTLRLVFDGARPGRTGGKE